MKVRRQRAVSTVVAAVVLVVIIVVAAGSYYLLTSTPPTSSRTTSSGNKVFKIILFTDVPSQTSYAISLTDGFNAAVQKLNNTNDFTLKVSYAYNIGYGDALSFEQSYANQGYNLIIGGDFGYDPSINQVAQQFPNLQFFGTSFAHTAANVGTYGSDVWEGEFEAGVLAGLMTKSNIIGLVTAFSFKEANYAINAYLAGAQLVNKNVKVVYNFAGSFADPVKGENAAASLAALGADVIAGWGDGLTDGVLAGAAKAHVYSIGYLHDSNTLAPSSVITSVLWNQTSYMYNAILASETGQIGYKIYTLPIYPDQVVKLTPFYNVPSDVAARANAIIQNITKGIILPPVNETLPAQGV